MKPPAEINAEVTLPTGDRIRWDAAAPDVKKRPLDISFDTESGRGAKELASVTIIAPDALTADALATAVSVLGAEKGLVLIEQLPRTEAILVPNLPDAEPIFTTGARAHVR